MDEEIHVRRLAYRVSEVVTLTGASRSFVDRLIERGEIRTKKVGGALFLSAIDVERIFGFCRDSNEIEIVGQARAIVSTLFR